MNIPVDEVFAISEQIWSSMAGISLTPAPADQAPHRPNTLVSSSVQILGVWRGVVRLDMDYALANYATASLLGMESAEVSRDEIRDAAGELANMTGGGIKELLQPNCALSLPTVVMGTDFELSSVPQGTEISRMVFTTAHGNLLVTIVEHEVRSR